MRFLWLIEDMKMCAYVENNEKLKHAEGRAIVTALILADQCHDAVYLFLR